MSLINQMLQDLEKRRASASELATLPNQVRVLPRSEKSNILWWLAAAATLAALAAWQFVLPRMATAPNSPPRVQAAAADQRSGKNPDEPASRLAPDLEKSAPAIASEVPGAGTPLSAPAQSPAAPQAAKPAVASASNAALATPPVVAAESSKSTGASKPAPAVPRKIKVAPAPASVTKPVVTSAAVAAESANSTSAARLVPAAPEVKPVAVTPPLVVPPAIAPRPRAIEVNVDSRVQTALAGAQIDKRMQQLTPAQLAENEYRDAANFLNQGRLADAQDAFRQALQHDPTHVGARQGLFGLLIDAKRNSDAELLLKDGLKLNPNQSGFAMALARLQLDRSDAAGAIETLQGSAAGAQNSPDYLAFYAALLQRQSRHREAVEQYQAALKLAPQSGVWLMGLGISLQALNRNAEAQDAFRRAKSSNSLSPELQAFVDQRLRQLQ